jgi:hypothetical protein
MGEAAAGTMNRGVVIILEKSLHHWIYSEPQWRLEVGCQKFFDAQWSILC